jgi:hypothetical protein
MHIHPNQINPNIQQDALYAAEGAASKAQAERTRRKLKKFAAELSGEADSEGCFVNLTAEDDGQKQQGRQKQTRRNKSKDRSDSKDGEGFVSDWA